MPPLVKSNKKWEVSIMELQEGSKKTYKVTRKLVEMKVSETKMFSTKNEAIIQFYEWLK